MLEQLDGLANDKTHVLMEQSSSPSRARLVANLEAKGVNFYEYEPVDFSVHAEAASIAWYIGQAFYKFAKAKAILSLVRFSWYRGVSLRDISGFAAGRQLR